MGPGDEEQNGRRGLNGARILVVEDEYYLAEDLADALRSGGAVVVGPVGSLGQAEEPLAAGRLDGAVLDMNLRGEPGFALAERLQADGVHLVAAVLLERVDGAQLPVLHQQRRHHA